MADCVEPLIDSHWISVFSFSSIEQWYWALGTVTTFRLERDDGRSGTWWWWMFWRRWRRFLPWTWISGGWLTWRCWGPWSTRFWVIWVLFGVWLGCYFLVCLLLVWCFFYILLLRGLAIFWRLGICWSWSWIFVFTAGFVFWRFFVLGLGWRLFLAWSLVVG